MLLVPPLMLAADVYDVSPSSSAVSVLHEHGADPWVVDFGAPEHEEGGLERNLADHVVAVAEAVGRVRRSTDTDVHLAGYSQGGMFCYQTAAYLRGEGIDTVITFGSPVDARGALPLGIPEEIAEAGAGSARHGVRAHRGAAWMSRTGFRLLDPVKSLRQQVDFVRQLHDRERCSRANASAASSWGRMGRVAGAGGCRLPAPVRSPQPHAPGGFVIADRTVTLADIDRPVLTVVGIVDEIAPAPAVRAIVRAAPRAEVYELALRAGHFGLVVGSLASQTTWPTVAAWTRWRAGRVSSPRRSSRRTPSSTRTIRPTSAPGSGSGSG